MSWSIEHSCFRFRCSCRCCCWSWCIVCCRFIAGCKCIDECICKCINKCVNRCICRCIEKCICKYVNKCIRKCVNRCIVSCKCITNCKTRKWMQIKQQKPIRISIDWFEARCLIDLLRGKMKVWKRKNRLMCNRMRSLRYWSLYWLNLKSMWLYRNSKWK